VGEKKKKERKKERKNGRERERARERERESGKQTRGSRGHGVTGEQCGGGTKGKRRSERVA